MTSSENTASAISKQALAFQTLDPASILDTVERFKFEVTGRCFALNSYENRVYEIEVESDPRLKLTSCRSDRMVAKFYRPGRWTKDQILEEHAFMLELKEAEVSVLAPLVLDNETLFEEPHSGLLYTLYPKMGGRAPEDLTDDQYEWIGRLIARLHSVGSQKPAQHRWALTPEKYVVESRDLILQSPYLPLELQKTYRDTVDQFLARCPEWFANIKTQRIHGDCHRNNILWNDNGPTFLDFDDFVMGPCIQDLWLFIPYRGAELLEKLEVLLRGYTAFRPFNRAELALVEPLRFMRQVYYTAWIARRWEDPSFKQIFPQFESPTYWENHLRDLREQLSFALEFRWNLGNA